MANEVAKLSTLDPNLSAKNAKEHVFKFWSTQLVPELSKNYQCKSKMRTVIVSKN